MLTREQSLRKGRRLRRAAVFFSKLQKIGRSSRAKELYLGTTAGVVRVLGYGLEDPRKAPVYFDLHGGGFILGSADMDEAMNLRVARQVGCKIISIDYAKAPDAPYLVAVDQMAAFPKKYLQ